MKLLILVVNEQEKLDEILAGFVEIGITGATIVDSVGMGQVLSTTLPIFAAFPVLRAGSRPANKTIFSVADDDKVERALDLIEEIWGEAVRPGSGIAYSLPVERVVGLKPEIL
jgi:nitrogen regulatory protein PII